MARGIGRDRDRGRRAGRATVAMLVILGLVAAACGGDDDDDGGGSATTLEVAAEPTAADTAAPPSEGGSTSPASDPAAGDPDATLTYGGAVDVATFDPHTSASGGIWVEYGSPIFDGLTDLDAEGKVIPQLATSWEFVEEPDGWVLRFELRDGVVFHDGTPFDAAAAKANLERGKEIEGSTVATILSTVTSVEAVDDRTIDLHLSSLDVTLPAAMAHQAGRMISPASFEEPNMDRQPVAAGMYRLVEYRAGDRIVLERFDDYWDQEAIQGAPANMIIRILPDTATRLAALRTGELDVATVSPTQVAEAENAGFTIGSNEGLAYIVIYVNRARSHFDDVRVRQAMNLAIDREAIVQSIMDGQGTPTVQPFPPDYYAFNPDYPADYYAHDPDRARELLEEAGLEDGFSFEFLSFALSPHQEIAQAVQAQWAEVGIDAQIRMIEASEAGDIFFGQEDGDVLLSTFGGRPDPSMTVGYQFVPDGFGNPGSHSTPRMEELHAEAISTIDEAERTDVLHENVAEIVEQALQVPLVATRANYAYNDRVTGFSARAEGPIDLRTLRIVTD